MGISIRIRQLARVTDKVEPRCSEDPGGKIRDRRYLAVEGRCDE